MIPARPPRLLAGGPGGSAIGAWSAHGWAEGPASFAWQGGDRSYALIAASFWALGPEEGLDRSGWLIG